MYEFGGDTVVVFRLLWSIRSGVCPMVVRQILGAGLGRGRRASRRRRLSRGGRGQHDLRRAVEVPRGLAPRLEAVVLDPVHDGVVEDVDRRSESGLGVRGAVGEDQRRRGRPRGVDAGRVRPGLEVDDAVLAPLVLLHRLLPVELLVANVALEGPVVAVRPLVHLGREGAKETCETGNEILLEKFLGKSLSSCFLNTD